MTQGLQAADYLVFLLYFVAVSGYGWYIYQKKRKQDESAGDYFLAEGSLTWWAIGASLIASNISAEQFIGMSGAGFKMGLAVASYEWMAAATLIIVAIFFMPVYLKNKIYTMPQFLHQRYNGTVALIMAIFWLLLYVVVNLTSILFLGALAVSSVSGLPFLWCMGGLALFAMLITLGGMKVIGYTDMIQVGFLIFGGLATTYLALHLLAEQQQLDGWLEGLRYTYQTAGDHFHMILKHDHPSFPDLSGLSVLIGGMWIANFSYWGCNQYITQRALGASLETARSGLLFAAFLKLMMPLIVIIPGIVAFVLARDAAFAEGMLMDGSINPDRAYPVLLALLPTGLKGLSFAALTAAVVASLAGKANSIATIFTLDIYQKHIRPQASQKALVQMGKWTIAGSLVLAFLIAPLLGIDKKGGLQYIQEYTGFLSPGIFAMFLMGLFYRNANSSGALFATLGGFGFSVFLKFLPQWTDLSFLAPIGWSFANAEGIYEIPFLDRMSLVFLFCVLGMILLGKKKSGEAEILVDPADFKVSPGFLAGSILVTGILIGLYGWFW